MELVLRILNILLFRKVLGYLFIIFCNLKEYLITSEIELAVLLLIRALLNTG